MLSSHRIPILLCLVTVSWLILVPDTLKEARTISLPLESSFEVSKPQRRNVSNASPRSQGPRKMRRGKVAGGCGMGKPYVTSSRRAARSAILCSSIERVKVKRALGTDTENRERTAQVVCSSEGSEGTCARCLTTVLERLLWAFRGKQRLQKCGRVRQGHYAYYAIVPCCEYARSYCINHSPVAGLVELHTHEA